MPEMTVAEFFKDAERVKAEKAAKANGLWRVFVKDPKEDGFSFVAFTDYDKAIIAFNRNKRNGMNVRMFKHIDEGDHFSNRNMEMRCCNPAEWEECFPNEEDAQNREIAGLQTLIGELHAEIEVLRKEIAKKDAALKPIKDCDLSLKEDTIRLDAQSAIHAVCLAKSILKNKEN